MTRVLSIELRRSAALGATAVLLLAGAALLFAAPTRWVSSGMALVMAQREYLVLLWPLALAAGAWQGRREHRSKVGELFSSTPRPPAQRVLPTAAALAVAAVTGYLLMTAVGAAWMAGTARYLPAQAFVVLTVGLVAIVGGVWLGLAVGRLLPYLVTAPLLAVAGIGLLMTIGAVRGAPEWLAYVLSPMYGMSLYTDWQTVGGRTSAAQAIWLTALAIAALVLLMAGSWRTRLTALLPAALGAALAIAVIPHGDDFVPHPIDPVAQEFVCTNDAPAVCVTRVRAGLLDDFAPLARQTLGALAKLPDPPTTVREDTTTYQPLTLAPQPPGVILADLYTNARGKLIGQLPTQFGMMQSAFSTGERCEQPGNPAVERAAIFYLLGEKPLPDSEIYAGVVYGDDETNPEAVKLWEGLRQRPEQDALARVAAVRRASLACEPTDGLL
ncbi:hypothetical protein [Symbioplanes lichenis]|uniref:hypothetical protein n=1 Tax=Symbioplanes lichenis TaxID=1629072 RepID=UPI00273935E8|nr:hypothetical protein [Actinoplanes lichenis]